MTEKNAEPMPDAGSGLSSAERRLLAAMPLHAITSVHGETGLRERLLMEITQFSPAARGQSWSARSRAPAKMDELDAGMGDHAAACAASRHAHGDDGEDPGGFLAGGGRGDGALDGGAQRSSQGDSGIPSGS